MNGMFSLASRRILITGASSGIGRACAVLASRLGAEVVLTARRHDELEKTRLMMERPDAHRVVAGNLLDDSFRNGLLDASGMCNGLVHAAGVAPIAPVGMVSDRMLETAYQLNCGVFVLLVGRLARQSPRTGFSAVAVSSVSASAGWAGGTAYCASKGALSAAVRSLAVELAPKGIRINSVSPSGIRTPLYEARAKMDPKAAEEHVTVTQPLGLGSAEQVAAPVCFLLSDAASFVTGVDLPVDGGFLAR